jgi:hypothetical protein
MGKTVPVKNTPVIQFMAKFYGSMEFYGEAVVVHVAQFPDGRRFQPYIPAKIVIEVTGNGVEIFPRPGGLFEVCCIDRARQRD